MLSGLSVSSTVFSRDDSKNMASSSLNSADENMNVLSQGSDLDKKDDDVIEKKT